MADKTFILDQLAQFEKHDHLSPEAWRAHGQEPLSPDVSLILTAHISGTVRELARKVTADDSKEELQRVLNNSLGQLDKSRFEKERREFIANLFAELAEIVQADIGDAIYLWSHIPASAAVSIGVRSSRIEGGFKFRTQCCTQCKTSLEVKTLRENGDIPGDWWLIVRCRQCKELNVLELGAINGGFGLVNCDYVERLPNKEFTIEQALARVGQIGHSGN